LASFTNRQVFFSTGFRSDLLRQNGQSLSTL